MTSIFGVNIFKIVCDPIREKMNDILEFLNNIWTNRTSAGELLFLRLMTSAPLVEASHRPLVESERYDWNLRNCLKVLCENKNFHPENFTLG